jgi:predicted signal transduction protein with EAL and GGDEF domain
MDILATIFLSIFVVFICFSITVLLVLSFRQNTILIRLDERTQNTQSELEEVKSKQKNGLGRVANIEKTLPTLATKEELQETRNFIKHLEQRMIQANNKTQ